MIKKIFSEGHFKIHSSFLKKPTALPNAHLLNLVLYFAKKIWNMDLIILSVKTLTFRKQIFRQK